jgi:hypothetical protein
VNHWFGTVIALLAGPMSSWHFGTLVLAGTISLAQGCATKNCDLADWQDGLTVKVTSDEPLTSGTYRFVIEIPEEKLEVDLAIEDPANTQQGVYVSERVEHGTWQVNASLSGSTAFGTVGEVVIGRLRGETGGPESLSLTALQDDVEIGALELDAIDYREKEPNGPGCGVAKTAVVSISIAPRQ